jgi:tetratricopeptide (TPR) repeat protein
LPAASPADASPADASQGADIHTALGLDDAGAPRRFGKKHLAILACLALVVALGTVVYGRFFSTAPKPALPEVALPAPPAPAEEHAAPAAPAAPEPAEFQSASWTLAEQASGAGRDADALRLYGNLLCEADKNPVNRRLGGLMRFRSGRCLVNLNRTREARQMFMEAADCGSPLVRAMACYDMAALDVAEGQPMPARMRAYQAIASLGDAGARPRIEMQCEFLVAQALTNKAFSFSNPETPRPWNVPSGVDPFAGLSEADLRKALDEGAARQASTLLGPMLERKKGSRGMHLWVAASCGAPLEDVTSRIVAESGLDVRWENVGEPARRRPVVLSIEGVNGQRLIEVVCGAAGLVTRFTGKEAVVSDPQSYTSTADLKDLVVRESISLWRRFFMRSSDAPSLASGHFALALLHELASDGAAAMAEYQIIAREYPLNTLAPLARLRAATIRIDLRDFKGAREALLDLLNHYPDYPASDEVYLRLGQATMEAGNLDEAAATFKKLFFLELSPASRAGSAFGAAQCYFRKGLFDDAATWLAHRLELPRSPATDANLAEVYGLLARTEAARHRLREAVQAYKQALACMSRDGRQVEMLLELVKTLLQQEDYVAAYGVLERLRPQNVTPAQADEILLAKAQVLHAMTLSDQAVMLMKSRLASASSPETAARMTILLAQGLADSGDIEGARTRLGDLVPRLEAGPLAHRATVALAQVCLRGGRNTQAISLCRDLLKSSCSDEVRREARDILGRAYRLEKDYEQAVIVLSEAEPQAQGGAKP